MKKKIVIAVVVVAVLVATTVAMYFVNFSNDIPDKELVYLQLQLDGKDEAFMDDEAGEVLYENTGASRYFMKSFSKDIMEYTKPEYISTFAHISFLVPFSRRITSGAKRSMLFNKLSSASNSVPAASFVANSLQITARGSDKV